MYIILNHDGLVLETYSILPETYFYNIQQSLTVLEIADGIDCLGSIISKDSLIIKRPTRFHSIENQSWTITPENYTLLVQTVLMVVDYAMSRFVYYPHESNWFASVSNAGIMNNKIKAYFTLFELSKTCPSSVDFTHYFGDSP